tara:strand:- start:254 stop:484 length:231 start_codon:yes stop_codon:yes gene_type:complete
MSDRLIEENDISVDETKQQAIAKHYSDMKVMSNLIDAIDAYLIRFGRTSNVHDDCFDLKLQLIKNRNQLQDWVDKI